MTSQFAAAPVLAESLTQALAQRLGEANVDRDAAARQLAGSDIFLWPDSLPPDLVLRPGSTAEVADAVTLLAEAGCAVLPRGGGMSYTGGVVPTTPTVALDLRRLDTIRVVPEDFYAVVGAGTTWQALRDALRPHGLRAVQQSPISGSVSTIGGAAAQNLPGGMEGIIGLTVVLADGSITRTGSGAQPDLPPFWRHHGPDLTGIFLGDCGAYGVKTEVVLRLAPERPAAFASLGFPDAPSVLAAILRLVATGFAGRAFAMDRAKAASASKVDLAEALRTAAAVAGQAGSIGQTLKRVAGLTRTRGDLEQNAWTLHLTVEGATEAIAEALIDQARKAIGPTAQVLTPSVPQALHARPYSVRGMVGPEGERWVPVHGILAPSRAMGCLDALQARIAQSEAALRDAEVSVNWIMSSVGPQVTIEPMMYWRDQLDPIHFQALSERHRARFGDIPPNPAARAAVTALRAGLRNVFHAHGAVHAQLGRFYAPLPAYGLAARIKHMLDPAGRMNPGVLGL
ncbi:FAD-binding oxidoreductase [Humitalea sp. 24SJ18S-53]|uniref:FAD-binding oxidoreductase n=1 Tax=Humitalea sp. 24SJ18S-53 TaxID=3422307 RepID=UPI003D67130F